MKIKLFFGALNTIALLSASSVIAQNFQTMPVQSGYNADVIANGVGSSTISTTTDVDGVSFAFVAKDFLLTSSSSPLTYGIPSDGMINSVVAGTPGLSYKLGDLSGNNSLKLANTNDTGTLVFSAPKAAVTLYMLSTSGSGASTANVVVTFTDNSTQTFTNVSVSDWYGGTNFAIQGIGRINRNTDVLEANSTNPRLYQNALAIDAVNQTKPIQSVTVTKTSTAQGYTNVFAFSAEAFSDCSAPALQPVGTLTANSAQVSWAVPATTQASGYEIYYSTSNTAPTSGTTPTLTNIPGTSTTIGSLSANTVYYYWVRTKCNNSTGQSVWSFSGTFKTLCGPMTSMSENFDSYGTGNIVPDCWARIINTTGSQTITSTSPASGTRNIYQYSTAAQNSTYVVLPQFSNINAGTHWLRLKARVSASPGTLDVGYVTDATNSATFTSIQTLTISNIVYTDPNAEYKVIVPSSVPANARLAIMNKNDGKSYYWDDVYWEAIPSCLTPTAVVASNMTTLSADVTWTAPSPAPANGYEYFISTTNTPPTATTPASGTTTLTTINISNLTPNTTYYIWVRSVCSSSDASVWSYPVTFKTLCGAMTVLSENFDSYGTGNVVPDCWIRLAGTGSQTLTTTTPASGTRNVYQYTGSTSTPTTVVLPVFSNINSGTHKLRFKARVTTTAGALLNVGYVTNTADANSFVLLQALPILNTAYTAANSEYTVVVPSSVPANARLAIKSPNDGKSYYWDDISWEANTLGTSEVAAKKTLSVYPNPFRDVVYISDMKDVKSVTVNDVSGRIVKLIDNPGKELNLSTLNSGLYLLSITFRDGSKSITKVIKQ
ncbi:fibronectin type III domain-containing protein [Chryseobacterium limigenitum]|uniref:Por secretion system C-terminal sorting domain-containing protein n=1 Tax=Chryseobacterium limigenitum TaxID=1612149 RepID=A0A1K2IVI1_9FLAO|nr:fibronectin type III domain-containing protein [Chryseobacterium limigenitum]SFZ96444.1 Por secretion system C-terminal sorting domain-containing protein [Chryseobacterium limigenitum]